MGRRKKSVSPLEEDGSVLPEIEEDVENDDGPGYVSGAELDPGEWTIYQTGEPAADTIAGYVFLDPWVKPHNRPEGKPRPPVMAVEIKEREEGRTQGREVSIYAHNTKTDGPDLAGTLDALMSDRLQPVPDPTRMIWGVKRNPLPELREFDSSRTFHIVNRAWLAQNGSHQTALVQAQGGQAPGVSGMPGLPPGMPVSIFTGPSPLGMNPAAPIVPNVPQGIHGDIGGTGLKDLTYAVTDCVSRLVDTVQKNQLFYADLLARVSQAQMQTYQQMGQLLMRHPDAEAERYRLEHEYRMRQLDGAQDAEVEKRKETSGVIRDLGGKLLENPALTALAIGAGKKMGVDVDDVMKSFQEE